MHDQYQQLYLSVLKNISKEDLELLRLLINCGTLLRKNLSHVAGCTVDREIFVVK